jgi:polyphosphate kinase
VSENITVRSIVDRFLEHSRVYYFENGCQPEVFVSSADWLPRNCFRRIEVAFPVEDGVLRERIVREILPITQRDNTKARFLQPDGSYRPARLTRGGNPHRSQFEFLALAGLPENGPGKLIDGKARYPRVKLAPSPFAAGKRKV